MEKRIIVAFMLTNNHNTEQQYNWYIFINTMNKSPNISLTLDKEQNILIYKAPFYVIMRRSHKLLEWVCFLAHPVDVLFTAT